MNSLSVPVASMGAGRRPRPCAAAAGAVAERAGGRRGRRGGAEEEAAAGAGTTGRLQKQGGSGQIPGEGWISRNVCP